MKTIILDSTTKSLEAKLTGAPATTNPDFVTSWADNTGTIFTEGSTDGALNGSTAVTLAAAPASSTRRIIKSLSIQNKDTAAVTVIIQYNDNSTIRQIAKYTIAVNDTITLEGTYDSTGSFKTAVGSVNLTSQVTGILPPANGGTGVANSKNLTVSNSLTLAGTDSTTMTFPTTTKTIAANDGSNWTIPSQAIGDLAVASSTTAYGRLADVAVGQVLTSGGTGAAPAYSANPYVTTVELGHATDTTLARVSAGVASIEGVTIDTISGANTLTNKTLGTTQLGEVSLKLDAVLSADGTWSGITEIGTAGETLAFGNLCYFKAADSKWYLTDANADATAGSVKLGFCVLAGNANAATEMLYFGKIRADSLFPTMTIGAPVYVGETAGTIVVTQPTTADVIIRKVGFATTADELYVNISPDYIVHA